MNPLLLNIRGPQFPDPSSGIGPLHVYLAQLAGEPFLFARMSYGDELTLHFGLPRESKSTKLKDRRYGTYVLSFRDSPWVIKSGRTPLLLGSDFGYFTLVQNPESRTLTRNDLEKGHFVEEGSRVITATPYEWKNTGATGIHIVLSDGSVLTAFPHAPDPQEQVDEQELSSWELLGPHGLLKVGPGMKWEFLPEEQAA